MGIEMKARLTTVYEDSVKKTRVYKMSVDIGTQTFESELAVNAIDVERDNDPPYAFVVRELSSRISNHIRRDILRNLGVE
jgi:hypothetical protein